MKPVFNIGITFIVIAAILTPQDLSAQANDRPYMNDIDSFFALLAENKGDEAILALYKDSPYASAMSDAINNVAIQLAGMNRTYGNYNNHEVLVHEIVLERYAYLMFFVSFDRQPFKFEFHYYKPDETWQFQNFRFSDEIDDDIVEAAKYRLLRNFP